MSVVKTTTYRCDFCGYGGAYTEPYDFTHQPGGVDLCRWCSEPAHRAWIETGGHRVTFHGDSWTCTCAGTHEATLITIRLTWPVTPAIIAAVPRLANATAHAHLERR